MKFGGKVIALVFDIDNWAKDIEVNNLNYPSIQEINDAADLVAKNVDPDATIIFGTVVDESLGDQVRVTVIATGFNESGSQSSISFAAPEPRQQRQQAPAPREQRSSSASSGFDIPAFLQRSRLS